MQHTQSTTRTAFDAALLASASPYIVGAIDAEKNTVDQAHDRYTADGDIAEYREGYVETLQARAKADSLAGAYNPPSPRCGTSYDAYVRAWNDAWAAANNRPSWQLARQAEGGQQ